MIKASRFFGAQAPDLEMGEDLGSTHQKSQPHKTSSCSVETRNGSRAARSLTPARRDDLLGLTKEGMGTTPVPPGWVGRGRRGWRAVGGSGGS